MDVKGLKKWARTSKELALAVCAARALAEVERERVDAYLLPVFESFEFLDRKGEKIADLKRVWVCEDEELCAAYYAACDVAHREHGFEGPEGHCPALTAEALKTDAERCLLESLGEFAGVGSAFASYGTWEKALDLALGASLGTLS